jgi:hypothetical protein
MTIEHENDSDSADKKKRLAPACEIFDMLTAHADQYRNAITISKVQSDIEATMGVRLERGAISSRLRNIASKGLIVAAANGRGWWSFSDRTLRTLGRPAAGTRTAKPARKPARNLLKRDSRARVKGEQREFVESFIRATKKKGHDLVFTKESVVDFMRLNGQRTVTKAQTKQIAKAIGNMIFQQAGIVKTDRPAVYCVPADEERFNKSVVQRPDVVAPKNARRTGAKQSETPELRKLLWAAAEGCAAVQRAMVGLSDLIGNFKE